jgi:thiamine-monophosphate kinase
VPVGEFDLIERYFRRLDHPGGRSRADVLLGVGDDAALLRVPAGQELVAAIDTLVEGRHFLPGCEPASIGHRALAVNLSDLAAMGAQPAWALLALTLPAADEAFLEAFAAGLGKLAALHDVALVGGDTTAGPLTISVQVLGFVPAGQALRRAGAAAGDLLFVSGTPGDAAAGLLLERGTRGGVVAAEADRAAAERLRARFLYPTPRVALGRALRGLASACIDVSDGLAGDAGKLAAASGLGLRLEADALPLSSELVQVMGPARALDLALSGGDDYELCFSVPAARLAELAAAAQQGGCPVRCIGQLQAAPGLWLWQDGRLAAYEARGYDHFANGG